MSITIPSLNPASPPPPVLEDVPFAVVYLPTPECFTFCHHPVRFISFAARFPVSQVPFVFPLAGTFLKLSLADLLDRV